MSSGDHGAARIERSIWRRTGGTYGVMVWNGSTNVRGSFKTLKEARKFREEIVQQRNRIKGRFGVVRDKNVFGIKHIHRTGYLSDDVIDHRTSLRNQIESAPRYTVYRDGREFTLITLPEVMT